MFRSNKLLKEILERLDKMALDLTALRIAVAAEATVEASVKALLTQLTTQIQALIAASGSTVDPAELQAIVDSINANNAAITADVVANTPVPPATPSTTTTSQK